MWKDCPPEQCYANNRVNLGDHRCAKPVLNRAYLENRLLCRLSANAQALNQGLIAVWTAILQIIEQFTTSGKHRQKSALRVMILLMRLEMLRQLENPLAQKSHLHLWRSVIRLMHPVLTDNLRLLFNRQGHAKKRYSSSLP